MPVPDTTLKTHPGLNPKYFRRMQTRRNIQKINADTRSLFKQAVPKQPNKYVPHYGAKEAAKYATSASHRLGPSSYASSGIEIIAECLTNKEWGSGVPVEALQGDLAVAAKPKRVRKTKDG